MGDQDRQPLTGRLISIDQSPMPTTPLARKLDEKENMKRHLLYRTNYDRRNRYAKPVRKAESTEEKKTAD